MTRPEISKDFTVEDIRKIREYNSLRHIKMDSKGIVADTRKGAEPVLKMLESKKAAIRRGPQQKNR